MTFVVLGASARLSRPCVRYVDLVDFAYWVSFVRLVYLVDVVSLATSPLPLHAARLHLCGTESGRASALAVQEGSALPLRHGSSAASGVLDS